LFSQNSAAFCEAAASNCRNLIISKEFFHIFIFFLMCQPDCDGAISSPVVSYAQSYPQAGVAAFYTASSRLD